MSRNLIATAAALLIGSTVHAAALDAYDGDNNPIPGARTQSVLPDDVRAQYLAPRRPVAPAASKQRAVNAWMERASLVH